METRARTGAEVRGARDVALARAAAGRGAAHARAAAVRGVALARAAAVRGVALAAIMALGACRGPGPGEVPAGDDVGVRPAEDAGEGAANDPSAAATRASAAGTRAPPPALWFGGDVHLGAAPRGGLDAVVAEMGGAPGVVNLEGPIAAGPGGARLDGARVWLVNPADAGVFLRAQGVAAASVANNHAGDDGSAGTARTVDALARAGVAPVGAPGGPARLEVGGVPVALLAYDLGDAAAVVRARGAAARDLAGLRADGAEGTDGAAHDHAELRADGAARDRAGDDLATHELVVVALHVTGPPSYLPRPELVDLVDVAVAGGADVVVAHGTHVVGPVERRGDAVIAWGLGNLLFDCACTDAEEAIVLRVELAEGLPAEVVPVTAGLGGAPATLAADADGVLDLVAGLGGTAMTRIGGRGRF